MYKNSKNEEAEIEDEEADDELIECINNNIYFYNEITTYSCFKLRIILKKLIDKQLIYSIQNSCDIIPINLHINSQGGDITAALCIVDTIINSKVPINTIIEGEAASAATIISVVGHKRFINPNAHMLIHQIRAGFWGKIDECKDEMKNIKKYSKIIKKIYKEYTTLSDDKIDNFLKKDIYWGSRLCLKYGLVDEIMS